MYALLAVLLLGSCAVASGQQKAVNVQLRARWPGTPVAFEALEFMVGFWCLNVM
jgi:uncharacterized membrane protein YdcZ (DUF606 family)